MNPGHVHVMKNRIARTEHGDTMSQEILLAHVEALLGLLLRVVLMIPNPGGIRPLRIRNGKDIRIRKMYGKGRWALMMRRKRAMLLINVE